MEEEVEQIELDPWSWMVKVNERLAIIITNIKSQKDISDNDLELLKILFRIWNGGEYPLFATQYIGESQNVMQPDLFTVESSTGVPEFRDGMDIA